MSSVPSPRVRKPKPRARLNHLTMTISNAPTELAWARVRAFTNRGEPVAPQDRDMNEDIGLAAVRHNESIPLGGVEPFDPPGDFDQPDRALISVFGARRRIQRLDEFLAQFGPHS